MAAIFKRPAARRDLVERYVHLAENAGIETADRFLACAEEYSLDPAIGEPKFGPDYVVVRTPPNNVRMTTIFPGGSEVKIVDPNHIRKVQPFGCKVQFFSPTEP